MSSFWRKGKCLTIVSDLERGEPIWAGPERRRETLDRFFVERLPARRRRAVRAVCVDMCGPSLASIRDHLPKAAIVFDKFHVMRHVNDAVDETRRQESVRQKGQLRAVIRHLDGIIACCRHKVPFGVVEAINGTLRAPHPRYRDHEYLVLKAQKSTVQARLARAA